MAGGEQVNIDAAKKHPVFFGITRNDAKILIINVNLEQGKKPVRNAGYTPDDIACATGPINITGAKLGQQQVMATENIKRQETSLLIVTVEEAVLLMSVCLYVSGVNIQGDFFGRGIMAVEKDIGEEIGQFLEVGGHLVIAGIASLPGLFQPVEGGFSGEGRRGFIP